MRKAPQGETWALFWTMAIFGFSDLVSSDKSGRAKIILAVLHFPLASVQFRDYIGCISKTLVPRLGDQGLETTDDD